MNKQNPPGRPVTDNGPATYNGPTGTPRQPKQPADGKLPDEIPGQLVEVSDMPRIDRQGMMISKKGVALCVSYCIQNGVPDDLSISSAAKHLGIHRHTLTQILKNYNDKGQIGAIKILDGVDINDFNDIVIENLMTGYFDRVDLTDMANQELRRRLEENPEEVSTKALLDIDKNASQQTLNTMRFLMEKAEVDKNSEKETLPVSTDQVSELRDIFATATKRLEAEEKKNIVIDG